MDAVNKFLESPSAILIVVVGLILVFISAGILKLASAASSKAGIFGAAGFIVGAALMLIVVWLLKINFSLV